MKKNKNQSTASRLLQRSKFSWGQRSLSTRRRPQPSRIDYAALEQRQMLTVFIVDTASDNNSGVEDGFVSLREAIIAANTNSAFGDAPAGEANGDVIRFDPSIYNSTMPLHGQISISRRRVDRGWSDNITIQGNGNTRLFEIAATERVRSSKLTFAQGNASIGGVITAIGSGTTLLVETTFINNEVGQKPLPFHQRLPSPTETLIYGVRGAYLQSKLYLKRVDQEMALDPANHRVRLELTSRCGALMTFGLNKLADLIGYEFRSRFTKHFRIVAGPRLRLDQKPTDTERVVREKRMKRAWATAGVGKFAVSKLLPFETDAFSAQRIKARAKKQLPLEHYVLLRDQAANAKIGDAFKKLQLRMT